MNSSHYENRIVISDTSKTLGVLIDWLTIMIAILSFFTVHTFAAFYRMYFICLILGGYLLPDKIRGGVLEDVKVKLIQLISVMLCPPLFHGCKGGQVA